MATSKVLGIDLGTTYSCLAVHHNDKVEIIYNNYQSSLTPSCVSFYENRTYVGQAARDLSTINPENTLFSIKNIIGRDYNDKQLQEEIKDWPFKVVNRNGKPKLQIKYKGENKEFFPEEISALVLREIIEQAEINLGEKVQDAVITVPAYLYTSQRQCTKNAGEIAGLNVLCIISEPTAAALAYGIKNNFQSEKLVLIYDLGGGTLDVSIIGINNNQFAVKSTSGETNLGGDYFDLKLFKYCMSIKNNEIGDSPRLISRLRKECRVAKVRLSYLKEVTITIDGLPNNSFFQVDISRSKFNNLCDSLFKKTLESITKALDGANVPKRKIDNIVMVGGSTKIPKIRSLVQDYFDGKQLDFSINPDEAVAYGAAIQAKSIKSGAYDKLTTVKVVDVIPLSIGMMTKHSKMHVIIPRNSQIPVTKTAIASTSKDYQKSMAVTVFEGERAMTTDNHRLGEFVVGNIKRAKRGDILYSVTYSVDSNWILSMRVEEENTYKATESIINLRDKKLPQKKIKDMVKDSVENYTKDLASAERVKSLGDLEYLAYRLRRITEEVELSNRDVQTLLSLSHNELDWTINNMYTTKETYNERIESLVKASKFIIDKIKEKVENSHKRLFDFF